MGYAIQYSMGIITIHQGHPILNQVGNLVAFNKQNRQDVIDLVGYLKGFMMNKTIPGMAVATHKTGILGGGLIEFTTLSRTLVDQGISQIRLADSQALDQLLDQNPLTANLAVGDSLDVNSHFMF